jgi:hypothetical protein
LKENSAGTAPAQSEALTQGPPEPAAPSSQMTPAQETPLHPVPEIAAQTLPLAYLTNICRGIVVFGQKIFTRRKQEDLLLNDWEDLFYFNKKRFGPVFEDYGMFWDGGIRRSKRLQEKHLIKYH